MTDHSGRRFLGPRSRGSYTTYTIGCAIAWAIVLTITRKTASKTTWHEVRTMFIGWVSGWTSATIARAVYPPARVGR